MHVLLESQTITLKVPERSVFNQTNSGAGSRAILRRLLRDGAERVWPFRALRWHLELELKLKLKQTITTNYNTHQQFDMCQCHQPFAAWMSPLMAVCAACSRASSDVTCCDSCVTTASSGLVSSDLRTTYTKDDFLKNEFFVTYLFVYLFFYLVQVCIVLSWHRTGTFNSSCKYGW